MTASFGDVRLPARFWAKVELIPFSTCWWWTGCLNNSGGYPVFNMKPGTTLAYRRAYETLIGPVPAGQELDHFRCDSPQCVNPNHLKPMPHRQNMLRGATNMGAVSAAKEKCLRGHEFSAVTQRGERRCKICRGVSERARYQRIKRGLPPMKVGHPRKAHP